MCPCNKERKIGSCTTGIKIEGGSIMTEKGLLAIIVVPMSNSIKNKVHEDLTASDVTFLSNQNSRLSKHELACPFRKLMLELERY